MQALNFAELVTLGSLLVAFSALVLNASKSARADHERDQAVRDKLEQIKDNTEETRRMLREVDRKIDDHGTRIARLEERTDTLFQRVDRVETTLDSEKIGGTA